MHRHDMKKQPVTNIYKNGSLTISVKIDSDYYLND